MPDELNAVPTKQLLRDRHAAEEEARKLARARAIHSGWYDARLGSLDPLRDRRATVRRINAELARRSAPA